MGRRVMLGLLAGALGAAFGGCGNDTGAGDDANVDAATDADGTVEADVVGDDADRVDTDAGGEGGACDGPFLEAAAFEDPFDPDWEETQTAWRRASWMQNGTLMSPDRCVTSDEGMLQQTVLAGEPYRGGSMQSRSEFLYGRWTARLKPSSVPGALNSMFTMDWDDMTTPEDDGDGTHQEIDVEFLTYTFGAGAGQVHFAVHRPGHSNHFVEDVDLDFDPSADFHVWGFDILPDRIEWHVDGRVLAAFVYDDTVSITGAYEMFFNAWTQESWIHGPPAEDAVYEVDWVRFQPYDVTCASGG